MEVPLSEIELDMTKNPRPGFKDLDNFAKIIGLQGIHTPVALRKNSDGKFEILDGFRRCYAAKVNNFQYVPAIIYDCTEEEGKLLAAALHYYRKTQGSIAVGSHIYEAIKIRMRRDGYDPNDKEVVKQIIENYYAWAAKSMGVSIDEIKRLLTSFENATPEIDILEKYKKLPDKYLPPITVSHAAAKVAKKLELDPVEVAKIFKQENLTQGFAERILEDKDFLSEKAKLDIREFHKEVRKKKGELKKFTESIRREVIDHINEYAEANNLPRSLAAEELIELGYDTWKRQ